MQLIFIGIWIFIGAFIHYIGCPIVIQDLKYRLFQVQGPFITIKLIKIHANQLLESI